MKRALIILLATAALAVAQGDISSEFQNAPRQPAQPVPQPAPQPAPAQQQPAPAQPATGNAPANSGAPIKLQCWWLELPWQGRPLLRSRAAILPLGTERAGTSTTMRFFRPASKSTSTRRRRSRRRKPSIRRSFNKSWKSFRPAESRLDPPMKRSSFWRKLREYQDDANLCDSIANQVYSSWLARKNNDRLNAAGKTLEDERKRLEWNARLTAEGTKLEAAAVPRERKRRSCQPAIRGSSSSN